MIDALLDGLNEEQRRAVTTTGRGLCVTAGAGSGKTRVLVDRFIHLVLSGEASVPEILAITFTEKAAAEMKGRIVGSFAEAGRDDLRRRVEFAHISTIHAFCAGLLRENAIDAGVDPHFAVLEEFLAAQEARKVLEKTLEEWRASRGDDYVALTEELCTSVPGPNGRGFLRDVLELYGAIRSTAARRESWRPGTMDRDRLVSLCRDGSDLTDAFGGLVGEDTLTKAARRRIEKILDCGDVFSELARGAVEARHIAGLASMKKSIHRRVGGADVKALMRKLADLLEELIPIGLDGLVVPVLDLLGELLRDFDDDYRRAKRRSGLLDFNDLILESVRLLEENAPLRERVRSRFAFVLVDEFQDVDPAQKRLIDCLAPPERLFVVGDVKQSIYGFRNADVRVFMEHERSAPESGAEIIHLPRNYRSRGDLLEYLNRVFHAIWVEGDHETPFERLVEAREHADGVARPVEFIACRGDDAASARAGEAREIAGRIREIVEGEELSITQIDSPDVGRGLRYRDFAILLRATTDIDVYERALDQEGVPYYLSSGRGFWQTREVADCIHALEVIANARDEIALASVLRSPMVGASDATLLLLAEARGGDGAVLWDALGRLEKIDMPQGERRRLARFRADFMCLRRNASRMSLAGLVRELFNRTDFLWKTLLAAGGPRRYANLRRILSLARATDRTTLFDLREFVSILRAYRTTETRYGEAPTGSEADDVVRIMTIHAAKGLEFPVVVVPDIARHTRRDNPSLLFSPEGGLAGTSLTAREVAQNTKPARHRALSEKACRDGEEELLRLLYVAKTRAKEHLILSAALTGKLSRAKQPWLAELSQALEIDFFLPDNYIQEPPLDRHVSYSFRTAGHDEEVVPRRTNLAARYKDEILAGRLGGLPRTRQCAVNPARILKAVREGASVASSARVFYTVTELLDWQRCPRCHYYKHTLRLPEGLLPAGAGVDAGEDEAALLGSAVHAGIARFLACGRRGKLRTILCEEVRSLGGDGDVNAREIDRLTEGILGFFQSELWAEMSASKRVAWEEPVLLRHGEANFRGKVDLYAITDDCLIVVDFKTSFLPANKAGRRAGDYALQLGLYARALEAIHGREKTRAFCAFPGPAVWAPVDLGTLDVSRFLDGFLEAQETAQPEARRNPSCKRCAFQTLCAP